MALGRQGERQTDLMVGWAELPRSPGLSLRWVVNGLEFGCVSRSLRGILVWRVPTSWAVPGGSADGEDRLGC